MLPLNRSLITSIYSVGQDDFSTKKVPLPSDALVIVIQDRPQTPVELPLLQCPIYPRPQCDALPVDRRLAGKAYSEQPRMEISNINVSG
jgi:hypothetical protein